MKEAASHNRRSIRLHGYDYSQNGLYFVTICVQNKTSLLGKIMEGEMVLNDAGRMIEKWCGKLLNKFPCITMDTYIIMPNHFHAIIEIMDNVGAHLRVCPDKTDENDDLNGAHTGAPLHHIIQWFKTMTTNEYIHGVKSLGWQPFDKKLWQRNYYEHIIRDEQSHDNITRYIIENPFYWITDNYYVD
ncbi:hypothetical protein D0T84_12860 [Dysgonomonas sp. 521]|uniref:transposase n=1 Tax=Dysgonomonas sp. 521 TaxID=2302932 RepID=UPI0013D80B48|nr:transposase [Dysgonomonas sp. 521]NDV95793.1 hypothetical protein [Dysgonomonas sp. 521]